jgi:hypothetical protein
MLSLLRDGRRTIEAGSRSRCICICECDDGEEGEVDRKDVDAVDGERARPGWVCWGKYG